MKLIFLGVWAEPAVLGSAKTALKFIYKIYIGYYLYTIQCMGQFISFKSKINNPWFSPWFILLHTHSNVCATVEGWCLEYLVCITLAWLLNTIAITPKSEDKYVQKCSTRQVLQTIQMNLILLCVWAELAVLGSTKTAVKFIYKI